MSLRVALTPDELGPEEVSGACVFVIDILRATTTMCAAMHHGAGAVNYLLNLVLIIASYEPLCRNVLTLSRLPDYFHPF